MFEVLTAEEYKRAEFELGTVEGKRGFRIHAAVYGVVITGLIVLNALLIAFTDANFPWAVFPLVGWGIGLAFHYVDVYRRPGRTIRSHQEEVERYATRPRATA